MKPKLIVHIGSPKTGTTTIQRTLLFLTAEMRKICGVHYANTERGRQRARHNSIPRAAISGPDEIEAEHRALREDFERSGAKALFVTDEALFSPKARFPKFFKGLTSDFDIHVICYLRRQDYFVESFYNQVMRMKDFRGVPPITQIWDDENVAPRLDFHKILGHWSELTPNVMVRDFRKEVQTVGLLPSFQEAAGLTALGELKAEDANVSHDLRLLLSLCMLNSGALRDDASAMTQALFRASRVLREAEAFKPIKHMLGRIERDKVIKKYEASNAALKRDYGVEFSDERPEEPDLPMLVPDGAYLLALIGELSPIEATRVHHAAQNYLITTMSKIPKQRLFDPSLKTGPASIADLDFDAAPADDPRLDA